MVDIAVELAKAEEMTQALQLVSSFEDKEDKAEVLIRVAKGYIEVGQKDEALLILNRALLITSVIDLQL